ncbi:MAG TPA: endonuclease/exonuclease/phosphatase family protein [Blastocatellia bacterium]|nr:endonuclease/exonuclease/phosphatase family protein [Blastocatellia bacterium]
MTSTITDDGAAVNEELVAQLARFANFEELRRSHFYHSRKEQIRDLLNEARIYLTPKARPRLQSFLRVVEWNVERGACLEGIIETLNHHPVLRFADLLLLNELDDGMVRSGNRNVTFELSRALEASAVYGVEYLELTKGAGHELDLPGDNTASLHGNAILTRHSFSNPAVTRLNRCENNFESAERRLGGRVGIVINLEIAGVRLIAATTHLDVVNSPNCRAKQMRAMLEAIESRIKAPGAHAGNVVVGGDLNTHTFARGGRLRAIKNTTLILGSKPQRLADRLRNPERKEPAIGEFARFGYEVRGLNDTEPTSRSVVSALADSSGLPLPMKWWVRRRVPPAGLLLEFRLDWLAARGLRPLAMGEATDELTGVTSIAPHTVAGLTHQGQSVSDHDPIVVDLDIPL